ncbi:hypothetical protein AC579_8577 [Pseudocercospora musae]|uniref:Uncharacterized protein n=1 Tax=Pseudocercospora musae TaxID=113226 RepID=A0A139IB99_9PEZI|nr:hypothetical protein AC579_8577 [Pseudocercospora musae]
MTYHLRLRPRFISRGVARKSLDGAHIRVLKTSALASSASPLDSPLTLPIRAWGYKVFKADIISVQNGRLRFHQQDIFAYAFTQAESEEVKTPSERCIAAAAPTGSKPAPRKFRCNAGHHALCVSVNQDDDTAIMMERNGDKRVLSTFEASNQPRSRPTILESSSNAPTAIMAEDDSRKLQTGGTQFNETAELARALQELQKGERTATEMEKKLDAMEAKIEALLAEAEQNQQTADHMKTEGSRVEEEDKE